MTTAALAGDGVQLQREATPLPWREIVPALILFVAAGALSFIDQRLSLAACAVVFGLAVWRDPDLSLCLLVFSVPFDRLFHMQEHPALLLLGMQMVTQLAGELWHGRVAAKDFGRTALRAGLRLRVWPWMAAYVVLAIAYQSPTVDTVFWLKTVAFGTPALLLLVCYDGRMGPRSRRAAITGLLVGALFQIVFDLAVRFGVPNLLLRPDSIPYEPVHNGRLSGLTINANFFASVLLAAFCFVYVALLVDPRRQARPKLLLIAVLYSGVAQTFSKGPMLASFFVIAAVTGGLLIMGKRTMAGRSAGVAGLCAILVAVNVVVLPLLPLADSFAEKTYAGWIGPKPAPPTVAATPSPSTPPPVAATPVQPRPPVAAADPPKPAAAKAPPPQPVPSASEVLEKTLRVNIESTMTQLDDGRIAWHTAECETLCAGQRTRLWTAGWQVVREHWLTGIGFGGWRAEMKRLLQYPFSSPHNATLHMWGMFGLAGLALNLGLYAVLLRRLAGFGRWLEPTAGHMTALATGIYLAICMAGEAVETTEIFSLSRFGFFIWIMLAMHTSSAGSVTSAPAAAPSPAR